MKKIIWIAAILILSTVNISAQENDWIIEKKKEIAEITERIQNDNKNFDLYNQRSILYFDVADYSSMLKDAEIMIKLQPQNPLGYLAKSIYYSKINNFTSSMNEIKKAEKLEPENPYVYNCKAFLYHERKQYQKAIENHDKTISLDPDFLGAYINKAICYSELNNLKESLNVYEEVIKRWPEQQDALNNLVWFYAVSKDEKIYNPERALELALQMLKPKERKPVFLDTIAAAYACNGFFKEAVFYQEQAIKNETEEELLARLKERLKLYRNKQPYRE